MVYLKKRRSYAKEVQRAKREYEQSLRMNLEENADSGRFCNAVTYDILWTLII